jgi:hypothetical protein
MLTFSGQQSRRKIPTSHVFGSTSPDQFGFLNASLFEPIKDMGKIAQNKGSRCLDRGRYETVEGSAIAINGKAFA